ncbi:MAG: peptide ABC transporter substrate-binding protein [Alphaproteobacteria bacterium]|nr:peptide ABC transporter substrate-binding protein [Alphaproteobacteria bacterium]
MLKKLAISLICFLTFIELTPCLNATADIKNEKILRRSNSAEPQSLYIARASDVPSNMLLRDLYEGLVNCDQNGKIIPGAAQRWEIDETGKIYTFHDIRGNWSNGDPVTAHDFVFAWQHLLDPKTASTYAFILSPVLNAHEISKGENKDLNALGVKALDDKTLQVTLKAPTGYFLNSLLHYSFFPFHKGALELYKNEVTKPGKMVSNGAFMLTEWRPQDYIMLSKNPHYWDRANVKIDKVQYFTTEEQNTTLKNYRAGQLDLTYEVQAEKIQFIKRDKDLVKDLKIHPYLSNYYYGINLRKAPLGTNKDIREALSMVIDREKIVNHITLAGEIPAYGFVPPMTANAKPVSLSFQALSTEDRLKRAKELYEKAGYNLKNPLKFEFSYNTDENHKKVALAVIDMWKQAFPGIEVTLRNLEWKVFLQERSEGKNIEMYRGGWAGDYNDPLTFLEIFKSDSGVNHCGYNSPQYDALLEQASIAVDLEKRAEIFGQAEKILLEDAPLLPIYNRVTARLVKPWVKGYGIGGSNLLDIFYSKDLDIVK